MRLQKRLYILVTIWVTIRGNTEHLGMARLPLSFANVTVPALGGQFKGLQPEVWLDGSEE